LIIACKHKVLDYISLQYGERFTRPFLLVLLEKVKEYVFFITNHC